MLMIGHRREEFLDCGNRRGQRALIIIRQAEPCFRRDRRPSSNAAQEKSIVNTSLAIFVTRPTNHAESSS